MVQATLDNFLTKNPKFDVPKNFHKIAGLVARIQDSQGKTQTPAKRPASTQSFLAVPGRPERVKRVRPFVNLPLYLSCSILTSVDRLNAYVCPKKRSATPMTKCPPFLTTIPLLLLPSSHLFRMSPLTLVIHQESRSSSISRPPSYPLLLRFYRLPSTRVNLAKFLLPLLLTLALLFLLKLWTLAQVSIPLPFFHL